MRCAECISDALFEYFKCTYPALAESGAEKEVSVAEMINSGISPEGFLTDGLAGGWVEQEIKSIKEAKK